MNSMASAMFAIVFAPIRGRASRLPSPTAAFKSSIDSILSSCHSLLTVLGPRPGTAMTSIRPSGTSFRSAIKSVISPVSRNSMIFAALDFPMPSIASPTTLNNLPLISVPIGIKIGLPVVETSIPLFNPSVESIATARIVFSPMCCWHSTIMFWPFSFLTSRAS